MARVTMPLMSGDARGGFGGVLVFTNWKGRATVRKLVIPANPRTQGQQDSRNMVRVNGAGQRFANNSLQLGDGRAMTDKAAIVAVTPAGYAWNGHLVKSATGPGQLSYTTAAAEYAAFTAPQKAAWEAAAIATVPPFANVVQIGVGGVAGTPMSAGEVFYHYQYGLAEMMIAAYPSTTPPVYI